MAIKIKNDTVIYDDKVFQVGAANTASRPASPQVGMVRYNTEEATFEGYSDAGWGPIGGNSGGGGAILVNSTTVSKNYTITSNTNGFSVGPITVANGISVTVSSGQRWVVL